MLSFWMEQFRFLKRRDFDLILFFFVVHSFFRKILTLETVCPFWNWKQFSSMEREILRKLSSCIHHNVENHWRHRRMLELEGKQCSSLAHERIHCSLQSMDLQRENIFFFFILFVFCFQWWFERMSTKRWRWSKLNHTLSTLSNEHVFDWSAMEWARRKMFKRARAALTLKTLHLSLVGQIVLFHPIVQQVVCVCVSKHISNVQNEWWRWWSIKLEASWDSLGCFKRVPSSWLLLRLRLNGRHRKPG